MLSETNAIVNTCSGEKFYQGLWEGRIDIQSRVDHKIGRFQ